MVKWSYLEFIGGIECSFISKIVLQFAIIVLVVMGKPMGSYTVN